MVARIFQPAKTAMQSGTGNSSAWVLEFEPETPRDAEPLMGWTSSSDMLQQVRLTFAGKDEAIAYAEKHGIPYRVCEAKARVRIKKTYADNFKFGRRLSWTH
jgi:hypothetical protein